VKKDDSLIIIGEMKAQCACGGWSYQGVTAETKKAIRVLHAEHKWCCPLEGKKAVKKK
jgi:hypothetical protein